MRGKFWLFMAGILGASAVAMSAYHAHGLEKYFASRGVADIEIADKLDDVETGLKYQFLHAIALVALAAFIRTCPTTRLGKAAAALFVVGVLLFSGSLYALALTGNDLFARTAPAGGSALIIGWLLVAIAGLTTPEPSTYDSWP